MPDAYGNDYTRGASGFSTGWLSPSFPSSSFSFSVSSAPAKPAVSITVGSAELIDGFIGQVRNSGRIVAETGKAYKTREKAERAARKLVDERIAYLFA